MLTQEQKDKLAARLRKIAQDHGNASAIAESFLSIAADVEAEESALKRSYKRRQQLGGQR